jgi:hypothetical protein
MSLTKILNSDDNPMNVDELYQSVNTESACRIFSEFVYRLVTSLGETYLTHDNRSSVFRFRGEVRNNYGRRVESTYFQKSIKDGCCQLKKSEFNTIQSFSLNMQLSLSFVALSVLSFCAASVVPQVTPVAPPVPPMPRCPPCLPTSWPNTWPP